MAKGLQIDL